MPIYSTQQIRDYIDDVDAVLRAAVLSKNLKEVYEKEKPRIVSLEPSKILISNKTNKTFRIF
jgi:hypothetical protein